VPRDQLLGRHRGSRPALVSRMLSRIRRRWLLPPRCADRARRTRRDESRFTSMNLHSSRGHRKGTDGDAAAVIDLAVFAARSSCTPSRFRAPAMRALRRSLWRERSLRAGSGRGTPLARGAVMTRLTHLLSTLTLAALCAGAAIRRVRRPGRRPARCRGSPLRPRTVRPKRDAGDRGGVGGPAAALPCVPRERRRPAARRSTDRCPPPMREPRILRQRHYRPCPTAASRRTAAWSRPSRETVDADQPLTDPASNDCSAVCSRALSRGR